MQYLYVKIKDPLLLVLEAVEFLHDFVSQSKDRIEPVDSTKTRLMNQKHQQNYIWHGKNEIATLNSQNQMVEFRLLGTGSGSEIGASIAVELKGKVYVPIHDYKGSLAALIDLKTHAVVESYRYTSFGEEKIFDKRGRLLSKSQIGNPWHYCNKRLDEETNLIYFGRRYYSASIGRWTTLDPAGLVDGPNRYAFVHNNPLTLQDSYGLWAKNPELQKHYSEKAKHVKDMDQKKLQYIIDYASRDLKDKEIKIEGKELKRGRISFGNGLFNLLIDNIRSTERISELSGGYAVTGIYNNSRGPGAIKAVMEFFGYKTYEVMNLRTEFCRSFLDFAAQRTSGEDVRHMHIPSSQGGIQAKNALKNLPDAVQQHIEIFNINGAKTIPSKYCSSAKNIQSSRDLVCRLDIVGQIKYRDQVQVIEAHSDASWFDHSISSPTMIEPLKWGLLNFTDKYR